MTTFAVLVKKELREQVRTHRLTVMVAVFLLFGLISPLTAKMLPELLKMAGEGMVPQLPTPTSLDALDQYLKNLTQMGLLAIILTAMGTIARERERGTAAMTLCKPVSRAAFVVSKFVAHGLVLAAAMAVGALACYYYVAIIWTPYDAAAFLASNGLLGLYLLVVLGLTLLASALFKRQLAAGGVAMGIFILLSIVGGVPRVGDYTPGMLLGWSRGLIAGTGDTAWPAFFVSLGIVAGSVLLAWLYFRNREL
jgi:ABC-2 type transport system permease protein